MRRGLSPGGLGKIEEQANDRVEKMNSRFRHFSLTQFGEKEWTSSTPLPQSSTSTQVAKYSQQMFLELLSFSRSVISRKKLWYGTYWVREIKYVTVLLHERKLIYGTPIIKAKFRHFSEEEATIWHFSKGTIWNFFEYGNYNLVLQRGRSYNQALLTRGKY